MKIKFILTFLVSLNCLSLDVNGSVIAFWDFNDGYSAEDGVGQIVHTASTGSGTLYQQRGDIDSNGKGGVAYADVANGISVSGGMGMAWDDVSKTGDNNAEFFLVFSTTNTQNIRIRFDIQGNELAGVDSFDLKFSTGVALTDVTDLDVVGIIKDFAGGNSTSLLNNHPVGNPLTYARRTYGLQSITDLNDKSYVAMRFDDWKVNDDLRIDNILVTGDVIPEPHTALLLALGSSTLLGRRRRG